MKAIRWDLEKERKEILYLIENPKVEDLLTMEEILELLCFKQKELRDLALKCLSKLPVEQIELVLLQLVQTIRFEDYNQIKFKSSKLLNLLLDLSKQSFHIASKLNWYLSIEREAEKDKTFFANLFSNSLYHLGDTLSKSEEGKKYLDMILKQQKIVDQLTSISNYFNTELASKDRLSKEKVLNDIMEGTHQHSNIDLVSIFKEETLIYLPLNTHFGIDNIKVGSGRIFKSALQPISLTFSTTSAGFIGLDDGQLSPTTTKSEMSVIFKKGDDLRQDVLITQMIKFMNDCLSCNNLELCLSPYHVLATGIDTGFVEIVPNSTTVGSILKQFGTIQEYFKKSDPDGILKQETIKTYVKSCAGYCIITYLLGIGDRHLE
jgi:phosphatidylinositol 3-kinase